jgi:cobalt-zinc-cadmium efflux system membrane fusion protein
MTSSSRLIKIAIAGIVVIGLSASVFILRHADASAEQNTPAAGKEQLPPGGVKFATNAAQLSSLKIDRVEELPLPVSDVLNGRIVYDENVTARVSSPISGRIVTMYAGIGDKVRSGSALVEIDSPDLGTAEADWHKALADETRKKLSFERVRDLFKAEVLARKDYESADADLLQAKAETKRAHLRIKNLHGSGNEEGHFSLQSPISGIVADTQVNPGLEVGPASQLALFVVTDLSQLWVIVDVPENGMAAIHPGQAIVVETEAYPNALFSGKVELVGLTLDPATRRVQVRCTIRNDDGRLKPEMFVRVSFAANEGASKAIRVPNSSIFVEGMYSYVFVETQPGSFEKRRITIKIKGYDKSYVDTGLKNGDKIVSEGAFLLNAEVASDAH